MAREYKYSFLLSHNSQTQGNKKGKMYSPIVVIAAGWCFFILHCMMHFSCSGLNSLSLSLSLSFLLLSVCLPAFACLRRNITVSGVI